MLLLLALFAIDIPWHPAALTAQQRAWCEQFAGEARVVTASAAPAAIAQLRASAASARAARLPLVADYLARAAEQAGGGDALQTERALQASAHGPVVVVIQLRTPSAGESPFAGIALGIRDDDDLWLADVDWSTPHGVHVLANLVARAGSGAQSTAPAAYLPYDPALRAAAGRSVIVWKNMTIASWYERELRPVAAVLNAGQTSGTSLARWYALRYTVAGPTTAVAAPPPIVVARQDVGAVLASRDIHHPVDLPTFLAVTFHTLNDAVRGEAPQQHRPATCLVLNWCLRHGGLSASAAGWRIRERAMLASLRALQKELLSIESGGDGERAKRLLDDYGTLTPQLSATLDRLPPPNAPKTEVRYVILDGR